MSKPVVAVVGRPNVGKSTLFNKLIGQRLAIVEDTPGVTRDRIFYDCNWGGRTFLLVDTGGIEPHSDDVILSHIRRQAQLGLGGVLGIAGKLSSHRGAGDLHLLRVFIIGAAVLKAHHDLVHMPGQHLRGQAGDGVALMHGGGDMQL